MGVSDRADRLDRQIVQALQLDGRIAFARLAAAVGVSDQTVTRRYTRLRTTGRLRVRGLVDPQRLGQMRWLVRVRCALDATEAIAGTLAARADTAWISQTTGGGELHCVVTTPSATEAGLLRALRRTPAVLELSAQHVLHTFVGRAAPAVAKLGALHTAQVAPLPPPASCPVEPDAPPPELDELDRALLRLLHVDGRLPLGGLAVQAGTSRNTVQRRIATLRESGVLYFDVDVDRSLLDRPLRTLLRLVVAPAHLHATGAALASDPETVFVAAATGRANLCATVVTRNVAALYAYLTGTIAALPHVREIETIPVLATVKGPAGTHGPNTDHDPADRG